MIIIIREAKSSDAAAITRVHVKTWKTAYSGLISQEILDNINYDKRYQMWQDVLSNDCDELDFLYVAEAEGKVVGFISGGASRTGGIGYKGEIYGFYILQNFQRQGVGHALFSTAVQHLKNEGINSMFVWVLKGNSACQFYKKMGGKRLKEANIEIGGEKYKEVAYGWENLSSISI